MRKIGDVALLHRGLPPRVSLHKFRQDFVFAGQDQRLHAFDLVPRDDRAGVHVDDRFERAIPAPVENDRKGVAGERSTRRVGKDGALRRLLHDQHDELRSLRKRRMGAQHFRGRLNFRGGERVERMLRLGGRTRENHAQEGTQKNDDAALHSAPYSAGMRDCS